MRRIALTLAAAAITVASVLFTAGAATAHDELVATDPPADSTLEALPAQITLTFSGALTAEDGASEVSVTDAAGTSLADGAPVVADTVLTQALTGEASGVITVLWKVVSSDTHPISGEFTFTVAAPPSPTPTPTPTATPTETASPTEAPTGTASPAPPADEDSTFADVWPWVIGGGILAVIAGAVLYLLVSRVRRDKALAQGRAAGDAAPPDGGSGPPAER